jgi:hypothetical protein
VLKWLLLLGGLLIWAAHFFLLYGFASIFPGNDVARWLTIGATCAAMAANVGIIYLALAAEMAGGADALDRWIRTTGFSGALLSFLAVVWQSFPALL